ASAEQRGTAGVREQPCRNRRKAVRRSDRQLHGAVHEGFLAAPAEGGIAATQLLAVSAKAETALNLTVAYPDGPPQLEEPLQHARHPPQQMRRRRPLLVQRDGDLPDVAAHPLGADDELAGEQ